MSQQYAGAIMSIGGTEGNSVCLNGNFSQYLSVAKNSALEPATNGAWTLEMWVYATGGGASMAVATYANATVSSGSDVGYYVNINPGTSIAGGVYSSTTQYNIASSVGAATINNWIHIALVSTGSTMSLYVNGFSVGTPQTVTGVAINAPASAQFRIGNYLTNAYSTGQYYTGYISNLRFVKGTAVYTANFTPPTGPLQNIANTSLLTCQSPTIIDNSSSPLTITNNNSVVVSSNAPFTAYNPFAQNPALGASTPGLWTLPQAMQAVQNRTWAM